ncbi:MAG: transcription termination/antitermination NusG family protein [Candidatus Angelobacter sp.]
MGAARCGCHPELVVANMTPVQWVAVYVMPRHEKRVAQHFHVYQIEHFLPLYEARRRWKDGSQQNIQFPLFPSYLFARIGREKRVSVLAVPGVLWIVGGGGESSRIADSYIQFLRETLAQGRMEPHPYLVTGEKVSIKSGAMAGMEGVLVRKKSGFRVVVTLELIKRSVAVELDVADLQPFRSISLHHQENKTAA